MEEQKYCIYCMNRYPEQDELCPYCGRSEKEYHMEAHHLEPGTVVYGKYLVGKVLGEGGFGITYIGRDLNLDLLVAIKEYYPYGCVNRNSTYSETITVSNVISKDEFENGKKKLMDEARTLAKFSDLKGIVGVRDFFQDNNTAYIVMDYLDGITLKEYLKIHGKLEFSETMKLLKPIMEDLERVHETGLIHRDISPDNIMILKDGSAKMMDFGAARQIDNDLKSKSIVLKPGYTPEEQYRSKGIQGSWTDVYALCATIYRCITGEVPDDALQRCYKDELLPPSALNVVIGREQEKCLMKGLSVNADQRCQKISDLASLFEEEIRTVQKARRIDKKVLILLAVFACIWGIMACVVLISIGGEKKKTTVNYPSEREMTSHAAQVLRKEEFSGSILGLEIFNADENIKFQTYKVTCKVTVDTKKGTQDYVLELIYELEDGIWCLSTQSKISD